MSQTFIPGKDAALEVSIDAFQTKLKKLGFDIEEASWLNPVPNVWSVHIRKVVVTRPSSNSDKITIEAFGNPVTFYQLQDDGKPIKGRASKARYEVDKELLTLTGNAYLEQLDSNIKGDKITYIVPTQQMEAFSDKGKRVTTVLLPSQLQEKGPAANNGKSK